MNVQELIGGFFQVKEVSKDTYEVVTKIVLFANVPFVFYVEKQDGEFVISDHKLVCTFLSKIFDLGAKDVKSCIQEVLALNRTSIRKGEIYAPVKDEKAFGLTLANFLVSVCQLIRMQAFFEKAEN